MVKRSYQDIGASYKAIRRHACNQTAQSVIILVATEVDAMAAARMLTQLLRSDNIVYSMQPVSNKQHIEQEIAKFASTIKTVFMINCGAVSSISPTTLRIQLFLNPLTPFPTHNQPPDAQRPQALQARRGRRGLQSLRVRCGPAC